MLRIQLRVASKEHPSIQTKGTPPEKGGVFEFYGAFVYRSRTAPCHGVKAGSIPACSV